MEGPPLQQQQQGPTPQQMAQMQAAMVAEAQRRGLTPQQFQQQQRQQLETEAKAAGMTMEQYIHKLKTEAMANHQRQMQAQAQAQAQAQQAQGGGGGAPGEHQHQHQHQQAPAQGQQQIPIQNTGTPDPRALALAKWLKGQDLKMRTCILNGQRKEMFKVKRALRAIESPAYTKAASKPKTDLPAVTPQFPAAEVLKLLPLSLLALRVSKIDEHEGHNHAPPAKNKKRVKGLWTVKIEQQQDLRPELHYVWLWEGPQWRTKLYAGGALLGVFAVILFPLWPIQLRLGVWYLSMGMLGLIGLFFAMAIFRLILFIVTMFAVPPGLWLYPNLFEDVGFFDSFKPVWGWQEDKKAVAKAKRDARKPKSKDGASTTDGAPSTTSTTTGATPTVTPAVAAAAVDNSSGEKQGESTTSGALLGAVAGAGVTSRRGLPPSVEEAGSDESD